MYRLFLLFLNNKHILGKDKILTDTLQILVSACSR